MPWTPGRHPRGMLITVHSELLPDDRKPAFQIWWCWTHLARDGGHGLMRLTGTHYLQKLRPDPEVTKLDPLSIAPPRNSVQIGYKQNRWQRAALAESNAHWKWVSFTARNRKPRSGTSHRGSSWPISGGYTPHTPKNPLQHSPGYAAKCLLQILFRLHG